MREIKFRGKRLDNGEWEYGDLLQYDDGSVCSRPAASASPYSVPIEKGAFEWRM